MPDHRFKVGQRVRLKRRHSLAPASSETYRVTATLPPINNSPQYRIRNDDERHERVATEDLLESDHAPAALGDAFRK